MKKIRKLVTVTLTLSLAFSLAACGSENSSNNNVTANSRKTQNVVYRTLDEIKESGTINIGVFSDKNPFGYVDENGEMVKNQFVSDGDRTYYFGDDGAQVFRKWIEGVDENGQATFRYINGKGYMVYGDVKVVGGYYGEFDMEGYWTAIENQFFQDKLDDGTEVTKYSGKGGKAGRSFLAGAADHDF